MTRSTRFFFILLITGISTGVTGQSLTGVTGMLNAPSANMLKDGTFYAGANYLNKNYIVSYGGGKYNLLIYYFDITFLPFLEVNFRNTRSLDNPDKTHTVDRMLSVRLRLLKERKYWPSIVLGGNDVTTTGSNGNQYFGASYLVISKNLELKKNLIGGTLGYAFSVLEKNPVPNSSSFLYQAVDVLLVRRHTQFSGFFGGISFSPFFLRQLTLMAEYDSKYFNIGGSVLLFKHLYILGVFQGMKSFSGGISYRVSAFSGFKKKNSQQGLP